jgi:hypothetical protein
VPVHGAVGGAQQVLGGSARPGGGDHPDRDTDLSPAAVDDHGLAHGLADAVGNLAAGAA